MTPALSASTVLSLNFAEAFGSDWKTTSPP
jgi:hypothetical protein